MSDTGGNSNIHFPAICGGYLPQGAANGVRSESVRGCSAIAQGDGVWLIEPFDRSVNTYEQMVMLFNIGPDPIAGVSPTAIVGPFVSTSGLIAPDFYLGSFVDGGEGAEFEDVALCFEAKRIPRNK